MRQWRAMLLNSEGFVVSTPMTPVCRTDSVIGKSSSLARFLNGVAYFAPNEAFEGSTAQALMLPLSVHAEWDLNVIVHTWNCDASEGSVRATLRADVRRNILFPNTLMWPQARYREFSTLTHLSDCSAKELQGHATSPSEAATFRSNDEND